MQVCKIFSEIPSYGTYVINRISYKIELKCKIFILKRYVNKNLVLSGGKHKDDDTGSIRYEYIKSYIKDI